MSSLQNHNKRLLAIALLWLALLTGCARNIATKSIRLAEVEEPRRGESFVREAAKPGEQVLRVAVASVISPKGTITSYSDLVSYLGRRLQMRAELVQRASYVETNDLVRQGKVDVALVCSGAYVAGSRDGSMELLVAPQVSGRTVYYSYIIVPKESPVQEIRQLRGKVFAFTDPLSNTGRLAMVYLLHQMGERPETFFQKVIYTYSHDNSLKAVADRLVDGAAVDSLVYHFALAREPSLEEKIRVIHQSPPYGIPPVVVPSRLDPERKSRLRQIFLTMHQDPEGQAILANLMIDRFVLLDDSAYASIREMLYVVESGK